jgi:hypothetical protein
MVILDASRQKQPVPALAKWSLGVGIVATIGANVAHGLNHGPIGALVSAWPALALVGSFELLMTLTRNSTTGPHEASEAENTKMEQPEASATIVAQKPEDAVRADYLASLAGPGRPLSQRFLAEKHGIDRRKIKDIISNIQRPESA